jgi:hypothetical protein
MLPLMLLAAPEPNGPPQEVDLEPASAAELKRAVQNLGLGKLTASEAVGLTYDGRPSYDNHPDEYLNLYVRTSSLLCFPGMCTMPILSNASARVACLPCLAWCSWPKDIRAQCLHESETVLLAAFYTLRHLARSDLLEGIVLPIRWSCHCASRDDAIP